MSGDKVAERPARVHSRAELVPTDAFRRCAAKLNDPRLLPGPPSRHVECDACPACGCTMRPNDWPDWPTLSGPLDAEDAI